MSAVRVRSRSRKRAVLLGVAALLSVAAALAIATLLFGDFGSREGRILATTTVLAMYGLLALPAAMLWDRRRLALLAAIVAAGAAIAAALAVAAIWGGEPSPALEKTIGALNAWLVAAVQTAALVLRRRADDPPSVRRLLAASTGLAVVLAALFTAITLAELDSVGYARVFGSLVVFDVLLVALQPILARARATVERHRIRVGLVDAAPVELEVAAPDRATAAAAAVRAVAPHVVSRLDFVPTHRGPLGDGRHSLTGVGRGA